MERNELEERIEKLEKQVRYDSSLLELIMHELRICGVTIDSNVENSLDFCHLDKGHEGLHENIASFKWGY